MAHLAAELLQSSMACVRSIHEIIQEFLYDFCVIEFAVYCRSRDARNSRHSATYFSHRYQNFMETARVVCLQFLRIEGGESEIGYSRKCINTV